MIGHYLLTLTEKQEDRVLTTVMGPGSMSAPCLLGAAISSSKHGPGAICANSNVRASRRWSRWHRGYVSWNEFGVAFDYDALCMRFGTRDVNNAIRNRILSNRARRVLSHVPVVARSAEEPPQ